MKQMAWILPAVLLFCLGGITDISVPGVYMDAVNPDYMVVRILHPQALAMPIWTVPGNMLLQRFPVLGQVYHGALSVYVGLPAYTLFGTGVIGIRLTNLWFGLLVLVAAWAFLRAFRIRPWIIALALAGLALDPGFLFFFRTQFYLLVLPLAPLLASVAMTEARQARDTRGSQILAGTLAGIACYGYFIYGFLVPVALGHAVWTWRNESDRRRMVFRWCIGFTLGVAPYALGFLLLAIDTGGSRGFADFVIRTFSAVHSTNPTFEPLARLRLFIAMTRATVLDVGPANMMLGTTVVLAAPLLKQALLLGMPALTLTFALPRRQRPVGLAVLAGFVLGELGLVMTFGDRLWLHHTALLLPVLYAALAIALDAVPRDRPRAAGVAAILVMTPLLFINAVDREMLLRRLHVTGGTGLSSDALDRFAQDAVRAPMPMQVFIPDWGVFMPFAMITRGSVPYSTEFSTDAARTVLCRGTDAVLVLVADKPIDRLGTWTQALGWGDPVMTDYAQRDGTPILRVARWNAAPRPAAAGC